MTAAAPDASGFRTFLKLWASQGASGLGSAVAWFSLSIYLAQTLYPLPSQRPELALGLSLLGLSGALPALLVVPLAGVWADRHDRRRTMLTCDLLSGALTLLAAALMHTGHLPLWALLVTSVLISVLGSFHGASFDTSYSLLVSRAQLPRAGGLMQTMGSLSQLLAPALAALLIALPGGVPMSLLTDALSFWLAAAVLWRLRIPRPPAATQGVHSPLKDDLLFGWRYILRRPPLLALLLTFAAVNFSWSPLQVFETLLLKGRLAGDLNAHGLSFQAGLALLSTLGAAGGLTGGVLVSAWGGLKTQRIYGVLFPVLLGALGLMTLGLAPGVWLAAAAMFGLFFTGPIMNAHSQAIWQAQVPSELQGRVFSVRRLIAQFTGPLSVGLAGLLAARFPVPAILLVLAGLLGVVVLIQLVNPSLRRVEDREYLEVLAQRP
ncbi:MFS transporter [Deinococcus sp. KNUC1210]|uniref:MFS transporter n=1 Tax=Deinococcus sp. KNUC1210 TaxID=2917691 RepID=UPI001EF12F59|nr:MFS transporter [Deinococcus sp. KNUC1210]ULH16478.1 MFS transporter [Deinococcus sp. KNUC1210]